MNTATKEKTAVSIPADSKSWPGHQKSMDRLLNHHQAFQGPVGMIYIVLCCLRRRSVSTTVETIENKRICENSPNEKFNASSELESRAEKDG